MTWRELVKHYFPDVSDDLADHILWEYTGFPAFWITNRHYPTPIARCRKQLRELKYQWIKKAKLKGVIR